MKRHEAVWGHLGSSGTWVLLGIESGMSWREPMQKDLLGSAMEMGHRLFQSVLQNVTQVARWVFNKSNLDSLTVK